tara:strand:+ start:74 stop:310 length:237 start_codon:yes stop_codon:yes gene_type:complete
MACFVWKASYRPKMSNEADKNKNHHTGAHTMPITTLKATSRVSPVRIVKRIQSPSLFLVISKQNNMPTTLFNTPEIGN